MGAFATGASAGGVAQPASHAASAIADNGPNSLRRSALFWVILEVVAALAIAVGIVWWTFPKREKEAPPEDKR